MIGHPATLVTEPMNNGRRKVTSGAADAHERTKNYLDPGEVDRLLEAAKDSRHGARGQRSTSNKPA